MRFETYIDKSGEHRWRLLANNERIVADSAEGNQNLGDCLHAIILVMGTDANTPIEASAN